MLLQLDIHNIAIIDKVNIEMGNGLNVLTGETGAGKSIIIDAINAILGERLSKDLIRTGKEKAMVEAVFQVDNARLTDIFENTGIEPEEDGTLIISREFTLSGKNTCRVNGKLSTVSMLKIIGERIIDIHGQFDNTSLLRTENHIDMLDSFGGESIEELKQTYFNLLAKYKGIKNKLKSLTGDKNERERKIDILRFQIDEIKKAKLRVGEEEKLSKQRALLSNSEKIIATLTGVYELLFSGTNVKSAASDNINEAVSELNGLVKIDQRYNDLARRLEDISYQLDDVIENIRHEKDEIEYNPDLQEQIEERIDLIFRLKRKYGSSIEEILQYYSKIEQELEEIIRSEEIINELNIQLNKTSDEMFLTAQEINSNRLKAAEVLENEIGKELNELEMKKAKFKVNIEFDDSLDSNNHRKFLKNGLDKVEFLMSTNAGEPLKPLSKIASGGEMSRIMLAIKTILANVDSVPTLIFDEIDIGISGRAAQKVGEKLSYISRGHQVICVTHLAQIACMADAHYLIEKISDGEITQTDVKKLHDTALKNEIARIIGGANITDITIKHAEEMLDIAKEFKRK